MLDPRSPRIKPHELTHETPAGLHISMGASNTNRLNKAIEKAGTSKAVVERRTPIKLLSIIDDPEHPPHQTLDRLLSLTERFGFAVTQTDTGNLTP